MRSQAALSRIVGRELGGTDDALRRVSKDPAVPPTQERLAQLRVPLARAFAYHLSAPHRIVPRIEDLVVAKRATTSMLQAARYYQASAFIADGPSVGVAKYGEGTPSAPYGRMLTSDERLAARRIFEGARRAAFTITDISGRLVYDELLRHAVEPILLGDDTAWTMGQVGASLSTYRGKDGKSVAGTTELVAVLRRLRSYFRLGDE